MESWLEQARVLLEEVEHLKAMGGKVMEGGEPKSEKRRVQRDWAVRQVVDMIQGRQRRVQALAGEDGALLRMGQAVEYEAGRARAADLFFAQASALVQSHARRLHSPGSNQSAPTEERLEHELQQSGDPLDKFRGDECFGKCLDLHAFHDRFVNLPRRRDKAPMSYLTYLEQFWRFDDEPRSKDRTYVAYLTDLRDYLLDFIHRAYPLDDHSRVLRNASADYHRWAQHGGAFSWAKAVCSHPLTRTSDAPKPSEPFSVQNTSLIADDGALLLENAMSAEQLASVGAERLKTELERRGLAVGGTVLEKAQRLYDTKGMRPEEVRAQQALIGRLGHGGSKKRKRGGGKSALDAEHGGVCVGELEYQVFALSMHVQAAVSETQRLVEKKQSRMILTDENVDEDDIEVDSENDEDEDAAHTIRNYPVGPDGRPMPYWMYKLRGLNREFKCEVCGNASYYGPAAFEAHFAGARHSQALRILGITNGPEFTHVSRIADALQLWSKRPRHEMVESVPPIDMEEIEDRHGNVMSRRTYEDLVRQGLMEE